MVPERARVAAELSLQTRRAVLEHMASAYERARNLFPFPQLGIDTGLFCEREHLTFTWGRPHVKNDHCFVEEKNRTIVRQVVGYDRFVGEHSFRQLEELYRALRLYVNCFQPSMKLLSKQRNGKKISFCYDPAKTPLQRLLLSGILPVVTQQDLNEVAQSLDLSAYPTGFKPLKADQDHVAPSILL